MAKNKYFQFFGERDLPSLLTKEELICLKKIRKGTANEFEQKLGYSTIINKLCRLPCAAFHEVSAIQSFNEGVRYVGQMLSLVELQDQDSYKDTSFIEGNINQTK